MAPENRRCKILQELITCLVVLSVTIGVSRFLQEWWGKPEAGWFASAQNAKLPVFYSLFWTAGSRGVDSFTKNWGSKFGLFVPPLILVAGILKQMF